MSDDETLLKKWMEIFTQIDEGRLVEDQKIEEPNAALV